LGSRKADATTAASDHCDFSAQSTHKLSFLLIVATSCFTNKVRSGDKILG
jgi:hypothetical protein